MQLQMNQSKNKAKQRRSYNHSLFKANTKQSFRLNPNSNIKIYSVIICLNYFVYNLSLSKKYCQITQTRGNRPATQTVAYFLQQM